MWALIKGDLRGFYNMTIYTRPQEVVFAESAKNGEVAPFPDLSRGWGITFDQTDGEPPMEWMNGLNKQQFEAVRYFMQRGVSEWSATEDYPLHALVQFEGKLHTALQANKGKSPKTSNEHWLSFDERYVLKDINSTNIKIYQALPTEKKEDFIFCHPYGLMKWQQIHGTYRSLECARKVNGWATSPLAGYIEANGALYSKTGAYKGLWTAALDAGLVLPPVNWHIGQYIFIDEGGDNFRVPDLRGYFDRNASMGSSIDEGRIIFSGQDDAIRNITGNFYAITAGTANGVFTRNNGTQKTSTTNGGLWYESTTFFDVSRMVPTAADNHPYNTAYPAWIKI